MHKTLCTPVSLPIPRSEQSVFIVSVKKPKIHHPESIHHWQSDRVFYLLLLLDQNPTGMCSLQLLCRFIFTHANLFGLLVALTSKPPIENEFAEVSYVCSQPLCHPPELQSSFHSSKFQPSELASDFEFSNLRCWLWMFFALKQVFGRLVRTFGSFGFSFGFPLFSRSCFACE